MLVDRVDEPQLIARVQNRAKETGGARADDTAETMRNRLAVYRRQTEPVAGHYRRKGKVFEVDGMGSMDEVSAAIEGVEEWVKGYEDLGAAPLPPGEARARLERFAREALARAATADTNGG